MEYKLTTALLLGSSLLVGCSDGGSSGSPVSQVPPPAEPEPPEELILGTEGVDMAAANAWFQQGKAEIATAAEVATNSTQGAAKNIILFIGDGMGISTVTAGRIYAGQAEGGTGEEYHLSFDRLPFTGLAKTYNTNQQTPDSAGTATAMLSGVKTLAGVVGVDQSVVRGDCASSQGAELVSALMLAEQRGKATGVVTTTTVTHATPASAYASAADRSWESDARMPAEAIAAGCVDIATQLVEFPHGDGLEVVLGGGRDMFSPRSIADPETGKPGKRKDGRDLIAAWQGRYPEGSYVWNQAQFDEVDGQSTDRLLGLFSPDQMAFEHDRGEDTGGEPSLAEMTHKALQVLQDNEEGFFLLVEAGRIDHAHHFGSAHDALKDTRALSQAVQVAMDATDSSDTLVIVTADHSHTLTMAGYATRGNPILGKVVLNDASGEPEAAEDLALDDLPYTTLNYRNGLVVGRQDLHQVDTGDAGFRQEALVPTGVETHAGEDVGIFASGPGAHLLTGTIEQNVIFHVMDYAGALSGSP